jgi:hypothetical protein
MTKQRIGLAVLVGIILAVLTGAGGQYPFRYIQPLRGLNSTHLPTIAFAGLFLLVIAIHFIGKLQQRTGARAVVSGYQLSIIMALVLCACFIPTGGLIRYFPRSLVQPMLNMRAHPEWRQMKLLEYTPSILLANDGKDTEEVVSHYKDAMGKPKEPISIKDVPWHAWWKPLGVWSVLLLFIIVGVVSLSVVVHHQWAKRERVRYPIAEVALSLLKSDEQRGGFSILYDKLFWIGVAIPFSIALVNTLNAWRPEIPAIQLKLDFSAISTKFPKFAETPGAARLIWPTISLACVGLSFLLASDIAFTLGITNLVSVIVIYMMISAGVYTPGDSMLGGQISWLNFGSCLGLAVTLIYIGRRYYWSTLKQAVTFVRQDDTTESSVRACRLFILSFAGACAVLIAVGLDFPLAIFSVFCVFLLFLICGRMNAECATFYYAPSWMLPGIVVGLMGLSALGPRMFIIIGLVSYVLAFDPFDSLMPSALNALKITEDSGHEPGRTSKFVLIGIFVTLAVAIPAALWTDYNFAADLRHGGNTESIYRIAERAVTELKMLGKLEEVEKYTPIQRILHMNPDSQCLAAIIIGFGLFTLCGWLRLRFPWWPLHPVLLLGLGSWPIATYSASFFTGWLIKSAVMKFGGVTTYLRLKPLMIGMVAGDIAGRLLGALSSWILITFRQ